MDSLSSFYINHIAPALETFSVININGFNSLIYFLANNLLFFLVFIAIGYHTFTELKLKFNEFVDDERKII